MKTFTLIITLAAAGACTHALAPSRSQSEIAIRTDPVRGLAVFNRVESLPDHAAEAEFAAGVLGYRMLGADFASATGAK